MCYFFDCALVSKIKSEFWKIGCRRTRVGFERDIFFSLMVSPCKEFEEIFIINLPCGLRKLFDDIIIPIFPLTSKYERFKSERIIETFIAQECNK